MWPNQLLKIWHLDRSLTWTQIKKCLCFDFPGQYGGGGWLTDKRTNSYKNVFKRKWVASRETVPSEWLSLICCSFSVTSLTQAIIIVSTSPGTNQQQQDNVASRMTDPIDLIQELEGKSVGPAQWRGVENAAGRHGNKDFIKEIRLIVTMQVTHFEIIRSTDGFTVFSAKTSLLLIYRDFSGHFIGSPHSWKMVLTRKAALHSGEAGFLLHKSSISLFLYKIRVSLCVWGGFSSSFFLQSSE